MPTQTAGRIPPNGADIGDSWFFQDTATEYLWDGGRWVPPGIAPVAPLGVGYAYTGTKPATVAGAGTSAGTFWSVVAPNGGASSGAAGGAGAKIVLTAGDAGASISGAANGGDILLTAGLHTGTGRDGVILVDGNVYSVGKMGSLRGLATEVDAFTAATTYTAASANVVAYNAYITGALGAGYTLFGFDSTFNTTCADNTGNYYGFYSLVNVTDTSVLGTVAHFIAVDQVEGGQPHAGTYLVQHGFDGGHLTSGTSANWGAYLRYSAGQTLTGGQTNGGVYLEVGQGGSNTSGTITNYGLQINGNGGTAGGGGTVTNWAIYSSSTASSQLNGALTIVTPSSALGVTCLTVQPGNYTAMTANVRDYNYAAPTVVIATGYATQQFVNYGQPSMSAGSTQTITTAVTIDVAGAPTATGTNLLVTDTRALRLTSSNAAIINAAASTYFAVEVASHSLSLGATTHMTGVGGAIGAMRLGQVTINQTGGAVTVDNVATLDVVGPPVAGSSVTLTNIFAIRVRAGTTRLDGALTAVAGATLKGATVSINDSSNFTTTIATGTTASSVTIGNALATLSIAVPTTVHAATVTNVGSVTDGYLAGIRATPTYDGAFTVTRHNYLDLNNPLLTGSAVLTDAAVFRFDAAAGTHKAVDAGTTKTTPGAVTQWIKVNVNGTLAFIPSYSSKTT